MLGSIQGQKACLEIIAYGAHMFIVGFFAYHSM